MSRLRRLIPLMIAAVLALVAVTPVFAQEGPTDIVFDEGETSASVTVEDASNPQQFRVTALAGQEITATATPAQEGTTLELTLQQEGGDFTATETAEDTIAATLPADGAYIITVTAANAEATPGFSMTVSIPPLEEEDPENGESEEAEETPPEEGEGEEDGEGEEEAPEEGEGDDGTPEDGEGDDGTPEDGEGDDGTPTPGDACTTTVEPGDTLFSIGLEYGATVETMRQLNPGLTNDLIFAGDTINVPCTGEGTTGGTTYTVQPGDNLFRIALRYGVTVDSLRAANPGISGDTIFAGDTIVIPGEGGGEGGAAFTEYTVQDGDTLFSISRAQGVSLADLRAANPSISGDTIFVGDVLRIPGESGGGQTTYVVASGDTLTGIAARFNTTVNELVQLNGITNPDLIEIGDTLIVP